MDTTFGSLAEGGIDLLESSFTALDAYLGLKPAPLRFALASGSLVDLAKAAEGLEYPGLPYADAALSEPGGEGEEEGRLYIRLADSPAAAEPSAKYPSAYPHGAVFFMVSEAKNNTMRDQPSLSVGYTLKPDVQPAGVVQSAAGKSPQTRFYVDGKEAFLARPDQERAVVSAMRSGKNLQIDAVGADDVRTTYQFSLSGFGAALDAARRDCA